MSKLKQCKACGGEVASSAKVCPHCGAKVKKKPILLFILGGLVLIGLIFGSSNDKGTSNQSSNSKETKKEEKTEPIEYTTISVAELIKVLEANALNAKETYKDKYLEITGKLGTIDASGKYISLLPGVGNFELTGVQCYIKTDEARAQVAEMHDGDTVTLRGKCTDVGEIMGYSLDIDSIDGYEVTTNEEIELVDGYIETTAQELLDALNNNALKAQNTYKDQMLSISGKLSNIDASGKYINIEPENDSFSLSSIQCYIKSDDIKNIVSQLSIGDSLVIKGKCKDVGEVLGYSIDIESIER